MSLITDTVLLKLWEAAQREPDNERAAGKLWTQLWTKYLFPEEDWVVSPRPLPGGTDRRRVDIAIEYMGPVDDEFTTIMLGFHEAILPEDPPVADRRGPSEVHKAMDQVSNVCRRYFEDNPTVTFLYVVTSYGTKCKAWNCTRGKQSMKLEPLFHSWASGCKGCAELNSEDGQLIVDAVRSMRTVRPSRLEGVFK